MQAWVMEELHGVDLGDERLVQRYKRVLNALSEKPGLSIPAASGSWSETIAAYRFFDNPSVTADGILSPHREASINRIANEQVILLAQDTTTLNLTRPEQQMVGAGPLNDENHLGIYDHVGLALTPQGVPLGVVHAECWARDWESFHANQKLTRSQKAMQRRKTPFADKESARWVRGYEQGCEIARRCPTTQIVVVSDSEADLLDCFAYADHSRRGREPCAEWITRAFQDRLLAQTEEHSKLWQACQAAPVLTTIEIEVSKNTPQSGDKTKRNQARHARTTQAEVRAVAVTVKGQARVEGPLPSQVIHAVYVLESAPPPGEKPVEWLLLTSLRIQEQEDVLRVVSYYVLRWKIELYFRILKVGCGIEELQFETVERYQRCLAIYLIVAWRVFYVMMLGRECPTVSCETVFAPEEWKALYTIVKKSPLPKQPPTLAEVLVMVASLGGYLNRKGDGPPGPQSTWIGMQRLKDFALAWSAFGPDSQRKPTTCV